MSHSIWNGRVLLPLIGSLGVLGYGCGDGKVKCPSELVIAIQSPADGGNISAANDSNSGEAGIQSDVTVASNLRAGDEFTLTVSAGEGAVTEVTGTANSDGAVTFADVTFPSGEVTLSVTGESEDCGSASDEITVNVVTGADCNLTITEGPIANDFFAPIPVLNSTNDSDAELPNFQANIEIATATGFEVELFVLNVDAGEEISLGTVDANDQGIAAFAATLEQGRQAIRATCSNGSINEASATNTVHVDTVVPECSLDVPTEGVAVTPDDDTDGDIGNGIQMTWQATVDDGDENDTEGEASAFFRDALEFGATTVGADGSATSLGAEFTSPGTFAMRFETQDHAGNPCTDGFDTPVILDGCPITIDAPAAVVTTDSDGDPNNGLQTNVTVTVGTDCEGRDVFVDCGEGEVSATVPTGGLTTVPNVTLDQDAESEGEGTCTARVVNAENFQTSDARNVAWDTAAPGVTLSLIDPSDLDCGESIALNEATDADNDLSNGFQIRVAVISVGAETRAVEVTNSAGTSSTPAPDLGAPVLVELLDGANDVRAVVTDSLGNTNDSGPCNIQVEDIIVDFDEPVDDGIIGIAEGTINGPNIESTICVTPSEPDVTVTITLNGATDFATTGNMGQFCTTTPITFSEGFHTLTALAESNVDSRSGSNMITIEVDLTPPDAVGNLTAFSSNHQTVDASWDAVADATYIVRLGTAPFSADPDVFLTEGEPAPGMVIGEAIAMGPVNPGVEFHVGVIAVDSAGNRSSASSVGPVIPDYDGTGATAPGGSLDFDTFGMRVESGDFNGDGFSDVAVSAPRANSIRGRVFIYYGSDEGIVTPGATDITADVVIEGANANDSLGFSMARIDWDGNGDGLAIGAPVAGKVFIFFKGSLDTPDTLTSADRDIEITTAGTAGDYFTGSGLGAQVAVGQLDAAGTPEDLVIAAPFGGAGGGKSGTNPGGDGGIAILYGGTLDAGDTITLSRDATQNDLLGLNGHIFENPQDAVNGSNFGERLFYLGDTKAGGGVGDLAVTYYSDVEPDADDNVIYVLRGRTDADNGMSFTDFGATDLEIVNTTPDTTPEFGISMGSISDQNGDGFRDIVLGASLDNEGAGGEGRIWIINGSATGSLDVTNSSDYLTQIAASSGGVGSRIGTGIANNAINSQNDVNGDGLEDLVSSANGGLFVWFGGNIPTGDVFTDSRDYFKAFPEGFTNTHAQNLPPTVPVTWAGDVNGDGLEDIVWADFLAAANGVVSGLFEVLFDE